MKDLALYLHIPFCVKKCAYCDFLSFPAAEELQKNYVQKLLWELREEALRYRGVKVGSVFIGGGTPSILQEEEIAAVMDCIGEHYALQKDAEITIESNPGTLTERKLRSYRAAGISRLSMGCQSLKDEELALLGRIHKAADFIANYKLAREAGFANINVDLMSALPGQSLQDWLQTLRAVIKLQPEHISAYSLIIEEGTPFYERYHVQAQERERGEKPEGEAALPDEEEERSMLYEGRRLLEESGYMQYELSNYAKEGFACRHNCCYWERGDYAGFGLGAASCVGECRRKNTEDLREYLEAECPEDLWREKELLELSEQRSEAVFLGLRLCRGVNMADFASRYGAYPMELYGDWIQKMCKEGLLEKNGGNLRLSLRGQDLANYVMAGFV